MTTPAHATSQKPGRGLFQRFVDWSLDHGGQIFGDERERLVWYEAILAMATFQMVGLPWAFFICSLLCPIGALPYLIGLHYAVFLPMLASYVHAATKRVDFSKINWLTGKVVFANIIVLVPTTLFFGTTLLRAAEHAQSSVAADRAALPQALLALVAGITVSTAMLFAVLAKRPATPDNASQSEGLD